MRVDIQFLILRNKIGRHLDSHLLPVYDQFAGRWESLQTHWGRESLREREKRSQRDRKENQESEREKDNLLRGIGSFHGRPQS